MEFYTPSYKVIIAGTRSFTDYEFVKKEIARIVSEKATTTDSQGNIITSTFNITSILSGGAQGADKLGERYAKDNKIPCVVYSAKWDKFGKSAGPIRNIEMANHADALIAFWDGQSKGTQHMIDAMLERQKEVHVIQVTIPEDPRKRKTLEKYLK